MKKHTNKNGNATDERQATLLDAKPPYQTPVVMPLGELARGWGRRHHHCGGGGRIFMTCGGGGHVGGVCSSGLMFHG